MISAEGHRIVSGGAVSLLPQNVTLARSPNNDVFAVYVLAVEIAPCYLRPVEIYAYSMGPECPSHWLRRAVTVSALCERVLCCWRSLSHETAIS